MCGPITSQTKYIFVSFFCILFLQVTSHRRATKRNKLNFSHHSYHRPKVRLTTQTSSLLIFFLSCFFSCMPYNTIITLVELINYNVEVWHLWHCINYVELFWPSSIKYVSDICFYFFCIVCKSVAPCCILMVICRTSHAEGIILFFKRLLFKNKMNSWNRIVVKAAISKPSSYLKASSNLIIFRSCHYTSQGLSGPLMFTHKHTHIHISFL